MAQGFLLITLCILSLSLDFWFARDLSSLMSSTEVADFQIVQLFCGCSCFKNGYDDFQAVYM